MRARSAIEKTIQVTLALEPRSRLDIPNTRLYVEVAFNAALPGGGRGVFCAVRGPGVDSSMHFRNSGRLASLPVIVLEPEHRAELERIVDEVNIYSF
tara:strand:+ start:715 stop:1005 length:291 start_codon:yes stop_codon:yes gene_type:complete